MNKKRIIIFFLILILLPSCSFDNKTGIWTGEEYEKKRVSDIEKEQINREENIITVFSSENIFAEEKILQKAITPTKARKNLSWQTPNLNLQNLLGNIYLSGVDNRFLKKKVGKNKISLSRITNSPLSYKNFIYISDDKGSIIKINEFGKISWKTNIYKKIYKKIYKNLTFSIYKNTLYVADNIGFIYALNLNNGIPIWIKNHGVPLKSKIKVKDDKIFLINQDNRLLCFSIKDGSLFWNIRSVKSFIKSQSLLSLALSKEGKIISIDTSGNLMKVNSSDGIVYWSLNATESMLAHSTDFFKSSDVVISNENIIFSTKEKIFSYALSNGYLNWKQNISSASTPIVDGSNVFFVTKNGYFVILNYFTGELISSNYIFKLLKKRKQNTKVTGFIMGSNKMYSVTLNGYLIISSAVTGKVESFKKIGKTITSSPIINGGKLFIYTENSKILGFN